MTTKKRRRQINCHIFNLVNLKPLYKIKLNLSLTKYSFSHRLTALHKISKLYDF